MNKIKNKKLFSNIIIVSLSILIFAISAFFLYTFGLFDNKSPVFVFDISATENDNVELYYYGNGDVEIKGKGYMKNFTSEKDTPWYAESYNFTSVKIEDGIINVGDYAFSECDNIKSVELGKDLLIIGKSAFSYCSK